MKSFSLKRNTVQFGLPTPLNLLECPVCGSHPLHIFRCIKCGEVRCGSDQCTGSKGSHYKRWARTGTLCRHCGEAPYRRLVTDSEEMFVFVTEYRRRHALVYAAQQTQYEAA
ncbi:MAG: hypothetical protein HQM02_11810 [Magnetococcales bacterium]|nr:hypothetical protein [Magnetococcales bacterium]